MRIVYRFPFKRKVIVDDHWVIPMQGGKLSIVETNGYATAIEAIFEDQPLEYAPKAQHHADGAVAMTITGDDPLLPFVRRQLDSASAFLECFYNIELITEEFETSYQGETEEEEALIAIKSISTQANESPLPLSFDMLTRAIMAAEKSDGPRFEATLVATARNSLGRQEFINSFRYSFLLIESLYGEGQFKKASLQNVLKKNQDFCNIVSLSIKDVIPARKNRTSDTSKLLSSGATVEDIIDHLVERRGFYFHGNVKRKDAWKPNAQGEAEALALLAIGIANQISTMAAKPLFVSEYEKRHYKDAIRAGAKIVFYVQVKYRDPGEQFIRNHHFEVAAPGTKPTPRSALEVAQICLNLFKENQPASDLVSLKCTMKNTGEDVFNMSFPVSGAV